MTEPKPLQRLVMVTGILTAAGPQGRPAGELADVVGFRGTPESRREQLARLIRGLQGIGVDIVNVAPPGDETHWVLRPQDSRIRLAFTPDQAAELARAALLADLAAVRREFTPDAQAPAALEMSVPDLADADVVLRALASRSVLSFTYNGRPREFDPASVQRSAAGWTVTGQDRDSGPRTFALARMSDVSSGPPGSGADIGSERRDGSDPLGWRVDEPVAATVRTRNEFTSDVRLLLGPPVTAGPAGPDEQDLTYQVTNRWVFLSRVIELGTRVRLQGSAELRAQLRSVLRAALT